MATIQKKRFWPAVILAGLIAGTLDITSACINFYLNTHRNPVFVLRYIASALFGPDAYSGNDSMAFIGLLMHYLIAFSFTVLFFLIYPYLKKFIQNKILLAVVYGIFIWVVMNLLLVPLTQVKRSAFQTKSVLINMGILIIAIGIPLSFLASHYYSRLKTLPSNTEP